MPALAQLCNESSRELAWIELYREERLQSASFAFKRGMEVVGDDGRAT